MSNDVRVTQFKEPKYIRDCMEGMKNILLYYPSEVKNMFIRIIYQCQSNLTSSFVNYNISLRIETKES